MLPEFIQSGCPGLGLSCLGLLGVAAACSRAPGWPFAYGFLLLLLIILQIIGGCLFILFRCFKLNLADAPNFWLPKVVLQCTKWYCRAHSFWKVNPL